MANQQFPPTETALLLVDALNEFLKPGGKLYPMTKGVAEATGTIGNIERATQAARDAGILVVYANHNGDVSGYRGWKHLAPAHTGTRMLGAFAPGSSGAEVIEEVGPRPEDVVAQRHWTSSAFANTDLDFALSQRGIDRLVVAGNRANTCIDSTGRYAVELGYHATLLSDAIAAFSPAEMEATVKVNWPAYAHQVLTTDAFIAALAS